MMKKIKKIQEKLKKINCDVFLITNPSNIFYLTGISGFNEEREFLMVISKKNFKFITSKLYQYETVKKISKKNLIIAEGRISLFGEAIKILGKYKNIGFEREDLKYAEYEIFKKNLKKKKDYSNIRID